MSTRVPPWLLSYALIGFERGLPLFAGAALAISGGGQLTDYAAGMLLAVLVLATALGNTSRGPWADGALFGLAPVLLAYAATSGPTDLWQQPLVWCIALPFAIYAANPALVAGARSGSPTLFGMLNALALAALAPPVVTGRIHWAIAILPFAAFRVASATADKLRPGEEYASSRQEAGEVARKILWVSGAWIAGWAGVTP